MSVPAQRARFGAPALLLKYILVFLLVLVQMYQTHHLLPISGHGICFCKTHVCRNRQEKHRRHRRDPTVVELYWLS